MTRTINLKFVILTNELKFETLEYLELLLKIYSTGIGECKIINLLLLYSFLKLCLNFIN